MLCPGRFILVESVAQENCLDLSGPMHPVTLRSPMDYGNVQSDKISESMGARAQVFVVYTRARAIDHIKTGQNLPCSCLERIAHSSWLKWPHRQCLAALKNWTLF